MKIAATTLAVLTVACFVLTVYPYLIYPALLRFKKALPTATSLQSEGNRGRFALLFCTYNEAGEMPAKVENLRQLLAHDPRLEVLVYDDSSTDETVAILENSGLPITIVRGRGRTGKAHGMATLAASTTAEYLIFTDANVRLKVDITDHLLDDYQDLRVGGVCGRLVYESDSPTATGATGTSYWRLEEKIKDLESRTGNVMGGDGSIFSVRRAIYPDFPDTVQDDFVVSMAAIFNNLRLIRDPRVVAYEQVVSDRALELERKIRIATRAFHTHIFLTPNLRKMTAEDKWRYYSHKHLRWQGGFYLAGMVISLLALISLWSWVAMLAVMLGVIAIGIAAARFKLGPLSSVYEIATAMACTAAGVVKAKRGHTMATWSPPRQNQVGKTTKKRPGA